MNTIRNLCCTMAALLLTINITAAPKPKKEVYIPMDYSACGYHASECALPDVGTAVYVEWQAGDCSPLIQQAIDEAGRQRPDATGRRGAVLLGPGRYRIDTALRINATGVVLRGSGMQQTVLVKHGTDRGALLYIEGTSANSTDTLATTTADIRAGATAIPLTDIRGTISVGDRIDIIRPSTKLWIESLGMNDFGGGLDYTGWKPTDIDISWYRTVVERRADTIIVDAPITTAISERYGGAVVKKHCSDGELTECGVENLSLESAKNEWNIKDEDHCWDGVSIEHARDCWVRRVSFRHFAGSAVTLQKHTSRVTVEDCIATEPVSEIGGWRRQVFLTRGQQTLFQRCLSRQGIHDFAAGFCAAGPNAFVQCDAEESLGFSGSIGSWAPGLLFDIVNIDGSDLRFANLEQFQFGTGWNTANSMFWQCTAATIECYSPDADNRSSAHGCWGILTGNGEWTSSNNHVTPRSLFYHQLNERLGGKSTIEPHLMITATDATTSPTVEQAMAMARQSLTERRMTLDRWIDSIPFTPPVAPLPHPFKPSAKPIATKGTIATISTIGTQKVITADGRLLTGSQYNIPWWNGRVKDNFTVREARPAITRFVPGREGTGWTDRTDSVVAFLSSRGYSLLYHHYGLWYDLRRTDHERIRRADGDVWAPFYEQPFARSGQGTAWDGLSRYDLTRPNEWYWSRLREFADKSMQHGILLFNNHYFQHNILEAGAHWVDCPWRPVNNINYGPTPTPPEGRGLDTIAVDSTLQGNHLPSLREGSGVGLPFPEPVPFAGDKRIFMAEQFYDVQNDTLRNLHRQYIRMCLDELKDQPNAIHLISAEYTGPLHFTRFWLQTIGEWEAETGRHATVALSCTRDAQDSIMADPALSRIVDIIDIRYWHYNTEGLWAPIAGRNMAPRQWIRKMPVGKTTFNEVYQAVREMRQQYPDKAVTYFAQQYPAFGWAVLMAGGSLPCVPIRADSDDALCRRLLADIPTMQHHEAEGAVAMGNDDVGYLLYSTAANSSISVAEGRYNIYSINAANGKITPLKKSARLSGTYNADASTTGRILWLQRR